MRRYFPMLLLILCALLFAGTFYLLLKDRFESGDIYPPSSSLRSDPLGTMIFFESLQALPGMEVERDHNPLNRLPHGNKTTYLHLAASSTDWTQIPADLYRTIDRFLLEGGRLVITLSPEYDNSLKDENTEADEKKPEASDKEAKKNNKETKKSDPEIIDLEEKWGLKFYHAPSDSHQDTAKNTTSLALPQALAWHGHTTLKVSDASWLSVYKTAQGVVLAEKSRGAGRIVVASDSYFLSNEALVRDRHPELLAWLVGSADHVIFDEAHLGIVKSPGIATLARRYQLHGGVVALVILAGLFIWKSSSSLVPRRTVAGTSADVLKGRASGAGFVSLLRRNIPPERILEVCLEEWRKSFDQGARLTPRERAEVEDIVLTESARSARDRDPVATYQKIHSVLHRSRSAS